MSTGRRHATRPSEQDLPACASNPPPSSTAFEWSRPLYAVIFVLLSIGLLTRVVQVATDVEFRGLVSLQRWFDVDAEGGVPAWFSCILLFACAQVMWRLSRRHPSQPRRWQRHERALAAVFVYLSIDELTEIHEQSIAPLQSVLDLGGVLYFGWIVLAVPLAGAFALLMLGYLRGLPARTRRGFVLAGLLYVGGAAGVEMIGALLYSQGNVDTVPYILSTIVEEGLEMGSLVLFLKTAYELLEWRTRSTT